MSLAVSFMDIECQTCDICEYLSHTKEIEDIATANFIASDGVLFKE